MECGQVIDDTSPLTYRNGGYGNSKERRIERNLSLGSSHGWMAEIEAPPILILPVFCVAIKTTECDLICLN